MKLPGGFSRWPGQNNNTAKPKKPAIKKNKQWEVPDDEMKVIDSSEVKDVRLLLGSLDDIEVSGIKAKPLVMNGEVYAKISRTMSIIESLEWSAFFNMNDGIIDNIYFPKQEGSSATVDFDDDDTEINSYEGIIHSHHNMKIGFSSTDRHGINTSYAYSILVRNGTDGIILEASRHLKTDDGDIVLCEADVVVDHGFDLTQWEQTVNERFNKKTKTYSFDYGSKHNDYNSLFANNGHQSFKKKEKPNDVSTFVDMSKDNIFIFDEFETKESITIKFTDGEKVQFFTGQNFKYKSKDKDYIRLKRTADGKIFKVLLSTFRSSFLPVVGNGRQYVVTEDNEIHEVMYGTTPDDFGFTCINIDGVLTEVEHDEVVAVFG